MPDAVRPVIDVAYGEAQGFGLPISVGVPFAEGALEPGTALAVHAPSGGSRHADMRVLETWPDGSVRWGLIAFGAGEPGLHELVIGEAVDLHVTPVSCVRTGERIAIDNGIVAVELAGDGPGPISQLAVDGEPLIRDASSIRLTAGNAHSLHETQRTLRIIDASPSRVRVRIEGAHFDEAGARHLTYRLDVELWAGHRALRLDHHFFHVEPDAPTLGIDTIAIDMHLEFAGDPQRHFRQTNHGLFYVPRHVTNPDQVAVISNDSRSGTFVEDEAMLLDDVDYPYYLDAPLVGCAPWLGVTDGHRGVYAHVQDMAEMQPKRISSAGSRLTVELWPTTVGPLSLPQGRSRRHVITLAFTQGDAAAAADAGKAFDDRVAAAATGIAGQLAALIHEERAVVAPGYLAAMAVNDQDHTLPYAKHVRFERYLRGLMSLDFPHDMFDHGDTADNGYSSTYHGAGEDKVPPLDGAPDLPRRFPGHSPTQTYIDLHEPVWTNNEYDAIWAFTAESMRTGRNDHLTAARKLARHNLEVDFLHYSDHRWLHRATPAHSVDHTTTGAYPSHFWTQGFVQYYRMTGDIDACEVAVALGDKIIENFTEPDLRPVLVGFNREIGWSVLALAHLIDLTREQRFIDMATELVDYLMAYDRKGFAGAINLSAGNDRQSMMRQIVGNFFGYASMYEGVDMYQKATGRADVHDWLVEFCFDLLEAAEEASREGALAHNQMGLGLAIGYERTRDERFLDLADVWMDNLFWLGDRGSPPQVKPVATNYRGVARIFGHLYRTGRLERFELPSLRNR